MRTYQRCRDWSEFCQPYEARRHQIGDALRAVKDATTREAHAAAISQLRDIVANNESWRRPLLRIPLRVGDPCNPTCAGDWRRALNAAKQVCAGAALTTRFGTAPVGLGDCQNYIHGHKPPTNVGANAHAVGYGPCADGAPPVIRRYGTRRKCGPGYNYIFGRCIPELRSSVSGLGAVDAMGPETARALARAAMASSRIAPNLYNSASALDQLLEGVQPGLSQQVTARAKPMIARGVEPQTAVEQALTESIVALAPKYTYPKQPALSGFASLAGLGTGETPAATPAAPTCGSGTAGLVCAIMTGSGALMQGVSSLATGIVQETRARDQQRFDQRMAEANAARRAVEEAAIRESVPTGGTVSGGVGAGTILLGLLGLAAAGGAVYFITKKK